MASQNGTEGVDEFFMSIFGAPVYPETGHSYNALGGNDIVHGSAYDDLIQGGYGNDLLLGNDGDDALVGQQGNDEMYGGNGDDFLHGGSSDTGHDVLNGGAGQDRLYGGPGNDDYVHELNSGVDIINDGASETLAAGYGGGNDTIWLTGVSLEQLTWYQPPGSNDLWLSSWDDFADGTLDDGVVVENFYTVEANTYIETVVTSDQWSVPTWYFL